MNNSESNIFIQDLAGFDGGDVAVCLPPKSEIVKKVSDRRAQFRQCLHVSLEDDSLYYLDDNKSIPFVQSITKKRFPDDPPGIGLRPFIFFGVSELISLLSNNGPIFMDGTFKVCPSPFYQLFTIMVYDKASHLFLPAAYFLMPDKRESSYGYALDEAFVAAGREWNPESVTCDFEKSIWISVAKRFPNAKTNGCYFHFIQALVRRMRKMGMDKDTYLPQFNWLPLADPETLDKIMDLFELGANKRKDSILKDFIRYFRKVWIIRFGEYVIQMY